MIAVTGANGFVGRAVCADLRRHGIAIRPMARAGHPGMIGIGDIGPGTAWTEPLAGCRAVVHLAARVHVRRDASQDPLTAFRRVNVAGTLALAEQAAALGVKRFVFVSSIKVNGEATRLGRPFLPDDAPAPEDPYGRSKLEAELALQEVSARTGLEVAIIRPPLVYGPCVRANLRAVVQAVASGVPLPFGAVRNKRSLIAVDNLADLIRHCLDHPAAPGPPLLASDGEDLSTPDLLRAIGTSLGRPARLFPVPPAFLSAAATLIGRRSMMDRLTQSLQVDGAGPRERLGWSPPYSVAEAFSMAAAAGWLGDRSQRKIDASM